MQYSSHLDKKEVLQQEYSQPSILPCPHIQWVVNVVIIETDFMTFNTGPCNPVNLWDWSSIMGRGGYKMGESQVRNFLHPPFFVPPLLKCVNFKLPYKNYLKTFCVPYFSMAKTFSAPPPFLRGKTLHAPPPSRFAAPPPSPLPVIGDQSLRGWGLNVL